MGVRLLFLVWVIMCWEIARVTAVANVEIVDFSTTGDHTCVLFNNSQVKCFGANDEAQLGSGVNSTTTLQYGCNLDFVDFGDDMNISSVVADFDRTCVVTTDELVRCFGSNDQGKLGIALNNTLNWGDQPSHMGNNLPPIEVGDSAKALDVSVTHTCVLLTNDNIKCFGRNAAGELGYEDSTLRGLSADTMGDSLDDVALGTGVTVKKVALGSEATCIRANNDQIKCWGKEESGRDGLGDAFGPRGVNVNTMGNFLPFVQLGDFVLDLDMGSFHSCAILANRRIKCWGFNFFGELGYENTDNIGDQSSEMGNALDFVDLGDGLLVQQVAVGRSHTCALFTNGKLKCWGDNSFGQLGINSMLQKGHTTLTMGNNLPFVDLGGEYTVLKVQTGQYHTCALLNIGQITCWGRNDRDQLGTGDFVNRGDGVTFSTLAGNLVLVDLCASNYALGPAPGGNRNGLTEIQLITIIAASVAAVGFLFVAAVAWTKKKSSEDVKDSSYLVPVSSPPSKDDTICACFGNIHPNFLVVLSILVAAIVGLVPVLLSAFDVI